MRLDQVFVALDLELTGLDPASDAIIEIAAVKFRNGETIGSWSTLVNPRRSIPHKISRLTGIQQGDLNRAPSLGEVAGQLIGFTQNHPLVGHSIPHDVACLAREGVNLTNPLLDTFELTNILVPSLGGRGLQAIAEQLGFTARQHHRAADDALATKLLFSYLMEVALSLDLGVVQEINRVAANTDWPLRDFFQAVELEKSRTAFTGGTSLRQMLAAKGGIEEASLDSLLLSRQPYEPLQPRHPRRKLNESELSALLGPDGPFAETFPGYEHREPQVRMLAAVVRAFNEGQSLMVEAGTGTGKSVAYLIPAAKFAADNDEHVVISTNTINLQDQLFHKDIPDLQNVLPFRFTAALLKGRTNYVCLRRYGIERRRSGLNAQEAAALVKVLVWLPTTQSGDYAELAFTSEERAVWPRISADGEHCLGSKCPFHRKRTCFLYRARWQAASSHLIVVNHALLLSELASGGEILPDYANLVIDEAHNLEEVATEQLGITLGRKQLETWLDDLSRDTAGGGRAGLLGDVRSALRLATALPATQLREMEGWLERAHAAADATRDEVRGLNELLGAFVQEHSPDTREYGRKLRLTRSLRSQDAWVRIESQWERLALRMVDVENGLRRLATAMAGMAEEALADGERLLQDLDVLGARGQTLRETGSAIVDQIDPSSVQWLESTSYARELEVNLRSAPLHVGELLNRELFAGKETIVLTSATLTTAGSFGYMADRLGQREAETLMVDSPFDYRKSTLLFIPSDIPEPNRPGHQKEAETMLIELCRATEGRALVLFTSHSQLAATFHAIRRPLQQDEILVLAQRVEGTSRRQLLRTFRSNPRTVLLGSASFWEGIDVVGDALSVLVIAKLPFAVPSDPIFAARSETFDDPFHDYSLPQTILKFKQGFGRLIRSRNDRGVVVVLDRRLQTKAYGSAFLRSLPQCTVRSGPARDLPALARTWLNREQPS